MGTKNRMGQGQNRKLKADFGRDKTADQNPQERRELARRQGSSKKGSADAARRATRKGRQ